MRLKMFLTVTLALVACAGSYLELAARCRCDRPDRGGRRAARIERRAARRGCTTQYTPATPSYNPPRGRVDELGVDVPGPKAASNLAPVQYQWVQQCTQGRGCQWVRVPVAQPAAVAPQVKAADCPPPTAPAKTPEPEPTKEETQEIPEVEPLGKASDASVPAAVYSQSIDGKIWRTDASGKRTQIVVLDDSVLTLDKSELPKPTASIEFMRLSDFKAVSDIPKTWGASGSFSPAEVQRWFDAETAWRPDPPVIPAGFASEIPQLDD